MPGGFDRSLLDSPLPPERSRRWWPIAALAAVVVAAAVLWLLAVAISDDDQTAVSSPPSSVATSTTAPLPELVAFTAEPPALYYPTVLPAGMELCAAALGQPLHGDEFCDPTDDARWIQIALVPDGAPGGEPVEGIPGITVLGETPPEVGVNINEVTGFRLWAAGVSLDQLIEVAASLPISDPGILAGEDEPPVVLDEGTLRSIVGRHDAEVRGDPAGGWTVYAGDLMLYTAVFFPEASEGSREMVAGLVKPRLVSEQHGLVVGGSVVGDRSPGPRAQAVWIQGGRWWHLDGEGTIVAVATIATQMEAAIAGLPTE